MSIDQRSQTVTAVDSSLRSGDLLLAYDHATRAIEAGDPDPHLRYQRILALARMGDTERAANAYAGCAHEFGNDEDYKALGARLLKDSAAGLHGPERRSALADAADAYHMAYRATHGYFTGINAATLHHLAGNNAPAQALASDLLTTPSVAAPQSYFAAATAMEALLLLGKRDDALHMLDRALALPGADAGARATTVRQLKLLASVARSASLEPFIERLRPPVVLYFCGHMFAGGGVGEAALTRQVEEQIDLLKPGSAYGALACGADIVIAEALLARSVELNIVLPFRRNDFIAQSVTPGGRHWVERFNAVLAAATQIEVAADTGYVGDPHQFEYGNTFAMGLARLRAAHLETEAVQLAIWNGTTPGYVGGTATSVEAWRSLGLATTIVHPGEVEVGLKAPASAAQPDFARESRAIIFTDYSGFSRIEERHMPGFIREVLGRIGEVLSDHEAGICFRNTWGDALFAVIDTPQRAAEIALSIQDRLAEVDPSSLGLPARSGMRVGLHHGPLYRAYDPATGKIGYFGSEVTRTARIEPITPVGSVYVTQNFAAVLALEGKGRFTTRYVGRMPLAKNFGSTAMHRLTLR